MPVTNVNPQWKQPYESPVDAGTRTRTAANDNRAPHSQRVVRIDRQTTDRNPNYTTTDEQFANTYKQAGITNPDTNPSQVKQVKRQFVNAPQQPSQPSSVPLVRRKKVSHKPTKAAVAAKLARRAKVSAINGWINSWLIFWYLTFQFPVALISTLGLGVAFVVYDYIANIPGGQALLTLGQRAIELTGDAAVSSARITTFITGYITGYEIDPMMLFMTPFVVVLLFGLFQIIICWFIYSAAGIKSLSGKSAGIKQFTCILAVVGMFIPVLNLFPLILIWTSIVWLTPR